MSMLSTGTQIRAAASAPAVAVTYAVIAWLVVRTGCSPPFVDTEVFGVPVTLFLLLALTVAALILIVFAGINAWRAWRVLRRRRRTGDEIASRLGLASLVLALVTLAVTAWMGALFVLMPCQ